MSARCRVLLVGAGNMGSHHARVISQSPRAKLEVLVDPRKSVGTTVASRYGATWAPELPDLDDIDVVVIAAATEAHYDLAMATLHSKKALLIEKPVSDSLLRTTDILSLADANDVPLMCGLLERFNPAVLTARNFIEEPLHVTATRHSPYAARIRTGVAWDLLVHDIDLAINVMGTDPLEVDAKLGFFHPDSVAGAEDVAETILRFDGGALAHISASRVSQRKIRQLSIYEPERLIEVDLLRRDVTVYHHVSENSVDEGRGYRQQTIIEIPELISSEEPLTAQFNHLIDIVEGKADAATERATILPSHRVIDRIIAQRPSTTA
jgi:predicted dehydrogenase